MLLRKRLLVPTALVALAFAAACASEPEPPEWLQGLSPRYPSDRYVVGVGAGPDTRIAAEKALRSIGEQTEGQTEAAEVMETWRDPGSDVHWALAVLDLGRAVDRLRAELAWVEARRQARAWTRKWRTGGRSWPVRATASAIRSRVTPRSTPAWRRWTRCASTSRR